jgi:hypothetical protein
MKRLFLLSFDPFKTDTSRLFEYLNLSPSVLNWRSPGLPGTILIITRLSIPAISDMLRVHMNGLLFMISEISIHNTHGWMYQDIWTFIKEMPDPPPAPGLSPPVPGLFGILPARTGLSPSPKKQS